MICIMCYILLCDTYYRLVNVSSDIVCNMISIMIYRENDTLSISQFDNFGYIIKYKNKFENRSLGIENSYISPNIPNKYFLSIL